MRINPDDERPPYRQIADQLITAITTGTYAPGARLPSAQSIRNQTGVAIVTGRRVHETLVYEGWAETRSGTGTFVINRATGLPEALRQLAATIEQDAELIELPAPIVVTDIAARLRYLAHQYGPGPRDEPIAPTGNVTMTKPGRCNATPPVHALKTPGRGEAPPTAMIHTATTRPAPPRVSGTSHE